MNKEIVYQGQSFFDKVIECTGDIENAFAMSLLNEKSITDPLEIGEILKPAAVTKKRIFNQFNEKNRPATALIEVAEVPTPEYEFPGEFPFSF